MTSTIKRRPIPFNPQRVQGNLYVVTVNSSTGNVVKQNLEGSYIPPSSATGMQVTASENHPGWNRRQSTLSDIGGSFSTVKTYGSCNPQIHTITGGHSISPTVYQASEFRGPVMADSLGGVSFPPANVSSDAVLDAWGAKAVALAKPTNSLVDLSVTLGELMSAGGIPHLIAERWKGTAEAALRSFKDPKTAADEYLNIEFGWKPLISDVLGLAQSISRARDIISQYERDSGKVVRRRWDFEPVVSVTSSVFRANAVPFVAASNSDMIKSSTARGSVVRIRKNTVRRWFSGAFTYHLPTGYSSREVVMRLASEADKLVGLSLTPETLWNLAPWSWAVDWFTNIGDVVSNVSDWSVNGLVMRYGYLMEHTVTEDTYTWDGSTAYYGVRPNSLFLTRESKVRQKANPFGFGVTWSGLSPQQLSIAAALGINRS